MAAEDLYADLAPPPIADTDLGVSPLGPAPVLPTATAGQQSAIDRILKLVTAGIAMKMGPGAGTGFAAGINQSMQQRERGRQIADQQAQQQYRFQEQQYQRDQQIHDQDVWKRQQAVQQTLDSLRKVAPTLSSKEEYDQYVNAYGQGLRSMGLRVDANYLRTAVPYAEPKVETKAQKLLDKWSKIPSNAELLKTAPEQAMKATVMFDRDGDGVEEAVSLPDLASLAKMPFAQDASGTLIFSEAGTSKDDKANADSVYADLLTQARAEGKLVDGRSPEAAKRRNDLRVQANKSVGDARRAPARPAGGGGETETRKNMRVDGLRNRFSTEPIVKEFNTISGAAASVDRVLKGTWSGPADMALVYEFMKVLDPNSVVRESEYASASRSGNIFSGWAAQFNGMLSPQGGFLSPQVRSGFGELVKSKLAVKRAQYDHLAGQYSTQIDRITGEPGTGKDYLINYAAGSDAPQQTGPQLGERRTFNGKVGEWDGKGWVEVR